MKKTYKIITAIAVIFSVLITAFFFFTNDFSTEKAESKTISINDGWYYYDSDGSKISVTLPCNINAGNTLELFHKDCDELKTYDVIATNAAIYDVEIYANKEKICEFRDNGREINDTVRRNIVCFGTIPEAELQNGISLFYYSENGKYNIPEITVSTPNGLAKSVFNKSLFCLVVSVAMIVIGAFALIFCATLATQKKYDKRVFCIGLFLILCGLWCISDSAFIQLLFGYNNLIFDLDFYLFMLMPIPLSYFVINTPDLRRHKALTFVPFIYYANVIIQLLLESFGVFTFFRMLYATHILMMVVGVVIPLYIAIKEYKNNKDKEVLMCIRMLASVGLIGAVAIFLYICFNYATYQVVYQTGLLLLMTVVLNSILKEFVNSIKYKTEALIYKELSEQDKMTKLDNRRSFDALIERMENGSLKYENIALLFMDVNFLKKTNDTYGHGFGDSLIIGAANCIKKAFGNSGYCYRIGGDEFCAVIIDPSFTAEELLSHIHTEIARFNDSDRPMIDLSLACGCSFIVENGIKKSVPDWKTEADRRMYDNKKEIKSKLR